MGFANVRLCKRLSSHSRSYDEYLISTKENKTAILLSYDEYLSMKETLYLTASKRNRDRLDEAVEQIENSNFAKK